MDNWNKLDIRDRAQYMKLAVQNGYRDIRSIREAYNIYADEKIMEEKAKLGYYSVNNSDKSHTYTDTYKGNKRDDRGELNSLTEGELQSIDYYNQYGYFPIYYENSDNVQQFIRKKELEKELGHSIEGRVLPEVVVYPTNLDLYTYYPIVSEYKYTGHSALYGTNPNPDISGFNLSKKRDAKNYNLLTNNCSDATREALEYLTGKPLNHYLFTTPGDVQDYFKENFETREVPAPKGTSHLRVNISLSDLEKIKGKVNDIKSKWKANGGRITNGTVKLRDGLMVDTDYEIENEKGRTTYSVGSDNYMDGVELTAIALRHFKDQMRKKYPKASEAQLEQYATAAFNNGMEGAINLINQGKIQNSYKPFIQIKKNGGYVKRLLTKP